jgi:hypothetical protein
MVASSVWVFSLHLHPPLAQDARSGAPKIFNLLFFPDKVCGRKQQVPPLRFLSPLGMRGCGRDDSPQEEGQRRRSARNVRPSGAKARILSGLIGTAEAVPFPKLIL